MFRPHVELPVLADGTGGEFVRKSFLAIPLVVALSITFTGFAGIRSQNNRETHHRRPALLIPKTALAQAAYPFSRLDTKVVGISLGMSKDEVEKLLGGPHRVGSTANEDSVTVDYYYPFGKVEFSPYYETEKYVVSNIIINAPGFPGPRGISIGDSLEAILRHFPQDNAETTVVNRCRRIYSSQNSEGYAYYDQDGAIESLDFECEDEGGRTDFLILEMGHNKAESISIGYNTD